METELTAMQRDVTYLMDRSAIMDCIARHARGCDRHDVDLITAAYQRDGIDEHGNVTVNNPQAIRALSMAARWVGSISPPGVTAYKEWDAFNVWQAGKTSFMRNWTNAYEAARAQNSPTRGQFDIAPLPRGRAGFAATLGGNGYGVSRYSRHPREAVMLVRFLASREEQASRDRKSVV